METVSKDKMMMMMIQLTVTYTVLASHAYLARNE